MRDTQYDDVTRIVVVFPDGTVWEKRGAFKGGVEMHLQDDERTLKIFPLQVEETRAQDDERKQAIADFVDAQSVQYRKHSALAVAEDAVLAVEHFGVDPQKAGWPFEEWKEMLGK